MPIHATPAIQALHRLRDLVAPRDCGGCGAVVAPGRSLCPGCLRLLDSLPPVAAEPGSGGPPVTAAGEYTGVLRQCLLAFKEHRRRDLAVPLARLLAKALSAVGVATAPLLLVPVPPTRRALRHRGFDHVGLLGRQLTRLLPDARLARVLACGSRPDSAGLGRAERAQAAQQSLRALPARARALRAVTAHRPSVRVILLDDIVTSGATLTAAETALQRTGVRSRGAVTVAATSRHFPRKTGSSPR